MAEVNAVRVFAQLMATGLSAGVGVLTNMVTDGPRVAWIAFLVVLVVASALSQWWIGRTVANSPTPIWSHHSEVSNSGVIGVLGDNARIIDTESYYEQEAGVSKGPADR